MEKKLYYAEFIGIEESNGQVSQIFGGLIGKSDRVTQAVSYKEARRNIAYRVDQKLHCGQNNVYVLFGPYPEKDGKTVVPNDVAEYNRTTNIALWQKTALFICDDEPIYFDQRTIDFLDRLIAIANTACDWHYDYWKNKHDDWDDDPYYNDKEWGYRLSFKVDGTEYELEERNSEGSLRGLCLGGYDLPLIDGIVNDIRQDKSLLKPFLIVCRDLLKKRLGYTEINQNAVAQNEEENNMQETQAVNPYDEMVSPGREPDRTVDLRVFAMYNGKKGYVNRTTTFWTKEPDFYIGNVFKNGVKVGSWTWNLEFKYPQYKPVAGSLGGDGSTAFNYAYPNDMKKMATNEERVNRTNCNGYLVAITVALAKVGIKTKYQPKKSYGAAVMDSSGPAPRTVTGRTHKKPEPVVIGTGIDENDLAFYE